MTTATTASVPANTAPPVPVHPLLAGQKALVTGANSGIGRGVAIGLAQAGADVVVNYVVGDEAADAVVEEIRRCGVQGFAHKADVSSESQVEDMFKHMLDQFGTIDILVNNAGLQRDSPVASMTLAQWNTVINVNLTGQFLCARAAIREFLRRGVVPAVSCAAGKIICMSSVHQAIPWAGHPNYASSKGGIKLLMESLAQEMAPHHIRVNGIAPGAIRTPINTSAWNSPQAYAALMTLVPYRRIGEPEDIARAAIW
ncbi:MAG: SDR family NAD(P)-dependent oxidoreductase, partial [Steroidobacteraceae bacterium]